MQGSNPAGVIFIQGDAMFDKRFPMIEYQHNMKEHLKKGQRVSLVRFVIINAEIGIGEKRKFWTQKGYDY